MLNEFYTECLCTCFQRCWADEEGFPESLPPEAQAHSLDRQLIRGEVGIGLLNIHIYNEDKER